MSNEYQKRSHVVTNPEPRTAVTDFACDVPYLTNAEPWPSRIGSALPAAPTPMHNPALDAAWDARHPPASEPEAPRAVVVGQVWRSKLYGFKRTVTRLSGERVHVEDVADGCTDVWPASNFVERHEWVSNPPPETTGENMKRCAECNGSGHIFAEEGLLAAICLQCNGLGRIAREKGNPDTYGQPSVETQWQFAERLRDDATDCEHHLKDALAVPLITARDAAVAREAKLQALCDMHATAMRLRKYGREPEWLGAAFTELRGKYEKEPDGEA